MARRPRELAVAALAVLALTACDGGRPAAAPTTPPPATTVSATPSPTPTGRPYLIGVLGDYGVDATPVRRVVGVMRGFGRLDAVVTTGDNAYCCGTAAQARFARRVLDPLKARVISTLGNHDVGTDDGAAFMRAFPQPRRWYTATVGPVQFVVLDSNHTSNVSQRAFLKKVLAERRPVPFRVVVFHHPGWSCSAHPPAPGVVDRWLPLFGEDVDLVLAGHNHTYERFTAENGTPYITTGGGGAEVYASARVACRGEGTAEYLNAVHHALRLTATTESLGVEAVGLDGKVFDEVTVRP